MDTHVFVQATDVWKDISFRKEIFFADFEKVLKDKSTEFLHVGKFYYYLFNLTTSTFDFMSDSIEEVTGYDKTTITVPFFLSLIHPDDVPYFVHFEKEVVRFFNQLTVEQLPKYKVRYDYRVRTKSGQYIRILHQMIALVPDAENKIAQTLCYHTDITYLKDSGTPLLSFIGLDGEPSFVDVANVEMYMPFDYNLTVREQDIVKHLAEGLTSNQIVLELSISPHTVRTHRQNILKKMELNNTIDLTSRAIREGWL